MAKCPTCGTPGAYVGFSSIECRNSKCIHFVQNEELICPCCGIAGHDLGLSELTSLPPSDEEAPGSEWISDEKS